jgi:hypothetical protein
MIHSDLAHKQYADTWDLWTQPVVPGKVLGPRLESYRFLINDLLDVNLFKPGLPGATSMGIIDRSLEQRRLGWC